MKKVIFIFIFISAWLRSIDTYAQYSIESLNISTTADTLFIDSSYECTYPIFNTYVNGYSPLLKLKTYYGDGTYDSVSLVSWVGGSHCSIPHYYGSAGQYSIKQMLYYDNVLQDSSFQSYVYQYCRTFQLIFFYDLNNNCIKDSDESFLRTPSIIKIDSDGVAIDTVAITSGFSHETYGNAGTIYTYTVLSSAFMPACAASISDTVNFINNQYAPKFLGLTGTPAPVDFSVRDIIPVTGVHDEWGNIYVTNSSCTPANATVTLYYSRKYDVTGTWSPDVSPAPASYTDSSITWTVTGVSSATGSVDLYYAIFATGGVYLTIGDTVHSYVVVTPIGSTDADPSNNTCFIIDTVRAGCDPNEMFVSPEHCVMSDGSAHELQYTINFTNTGNDTAHNIYVLDTLSDNIDMNSLRVLEASATMNLFMSRDDGLKIVRFDFPSINLLDSSHHYQCNGDVIFSVNTKAGLPAGTTISNRAGIYFDINPVVMTNDEDVTIGCATGVEDVVKPEGPRLYPNPANDELTITDIEDINTIVITDVTGQAIRTFKCNGKRASVDVATLAPGIYFVKINNAAAQKFIKL